jgi:hypothetical protein
MEMVPGQRIKNVGKKVCGSVPQLKCRLSTRYAVGLKGTWEELLQLGRAQKRMRHGNAALNRLL